MSGFRWLARIFLALVVVALLLWSGSLVYRSGWMHGYESAVLSADLDPGEARPAPFLAYPYSGRPFFGPSLIFAPFGLLFGLGVLGLFLFLIGGLFRMAAWRRWPSGPGLHHSQDAPRKHEWREFREWKERQGSATTDQGEPGSQPQS